MTPTSAATDSADLLAGDTAHEPQWAWAVPASSGAVGTQVIAVGYRDAVAGAWRTSDGEAWTWSELPVDPLSIRSVSFGRGYDTAPDKIQFLAADLNGQPTDLWSSADGGVWASEAVIGFEEGSEVSDMASTAGAEAWHSEDGGLSWHRADVGELSENADGSMSSVIETLRGLVAVGSEGIGAAVWESANGIAWRRVELPELPGAQSWLEAVATTGDGLVAAGAAIDDDGVIMALVLEAEPSGDAG